MQPSGGASAKLRLVSTLLGHQHVQMALACLGSLLRFSAQPLRLLIHDDGSLNEADWELLARALGQPAALCRQEANDRMADLLAGRPAARAFRAANPLAAKLLDATLLGPGEELAFCDADVLFLRPFARLFDLAPGSAGLFMADPQNAYSVRSWQLLGEPRLQLAAHVNSGIVVFRRRSFDLDLLEWFLAQPTYHLAPVWVEQTCWALLGQAAGCRLVDPAAVAIPVAGTEEADRQRVALHFVSPVRRLLAAYVDEGSAAPALGAPIEVVSRPARRLSAAALAATEIRRRWRRFVA